MAIDFEARFLDMRINEAARDSRLSDARARLLFPYGEEDVIDIANTHARIAKEFSLDPDQMGIVVDLYEQQQGAGYGEA